MWMNRVEHLLGVNVDENYLVDYVGTQFFCENVNE